MKKFNTEFMDMLIMQANSIQRESTDEDLLKASYALKDAYIHFQNYLIRSAKNSDQDFSEPEEKSVIEGLRRRFTRKGR